jgi:hypothetical protein
VPCCHHTAITLLKQQRWHSGTVPYRPSRPNSQNSLPKDMFEMESSTTNHRLRLRLITCRTHGPPFEPPSPPPTALYDNAHSQQAGKQSINQSISNEATNDAHHVDHQRNRENNTLTPPISNSSHPTPLIGRFIFSNATHGLLSPNHLIRTVRAYRRLLCSLL